MTETLVPWAPWDEPMTEVVDIETWPPEEAVTAEVEEGAPAKPKRKPTTPLVKVPKGTEGGEFVEVDGLYAPPKDDEIPRIVEVLTRDNFATHEDMAKVLHRLLFDMLRGRQWWTAYRGGGVFDGLEATEGGIRRWSAKRQHPNIPWVPVRINGPGYLDRLQADVDAEIVKDEMSVLFKQGQECPACGHPGSMHINFIVAGSQTTENSVGKCTAPLPVGPRRARSGSRGRSICGCDYATRNGIRR